MGMERLGGINYLKMKDIVTKFFNDHPELRDGVMKAYFAFHVPHFRCDPKAHNFGSSLRESACRWCQRTREQVRHDDLPAGCASRPPIPEIEDVILGEEHTAFALLARAQKEVPKLVKRLGMNGETLAVLHHTHGYDPETVASIVSVPPQMLADYHRLMELERSRSRAAQVKEIIYAR